MSKTLIIYSTTDGQTKIICNKIKQNSKKNELIRIISLCEVNNSDLIEYSKIIIGASIRYGKHKSELFSFIKKNKKILDVKKTAFFSVNVVARKIEKSLPETNPYMKKFLAKTTWLPNKLAVFAGKIDYPNYSFIDKQVIRFIMLITKGPTDTSKSYEFTNWNKVNEFAREIDQL